MKPNSTMWARFFQARLAWVSMTPLGRPVVPDVYMRRCTSSAAIVCCCSRSSGVRRSARVVHPARAFSVTHARTRASMPVVALSARSMQVGVAHQGAGARVLEDVADLGRGQPPVDGHGDGPEVIGGEHRLQELRAVVGEQGHHVATPDPPSVQPAGQCLGALRHLAVAERGALERRDRLVGRPDGVMFEDGEPVHVRRYGSCRVHGRSTVTKMLYRPVNLYFAPACPPGLPGRATSLGTARSGAVRRGHHRHLRPTLRPAAATTPRASPSCARPTTSARARCTTTSAPRRSSSPPSTTRSWTR